jgi:ribosomal protein S18
MEKKLPVCPDCEAADFGLDRRDFLKSAGVTAAAAAAGLPLFASAKVQAAPSVKSAAETAVSALYETLTDDQKKDICFDWDYKDPKRGLLRTFVSNNWQITPKQIRSEYYTKKQQQLIHDVFKGLVNPDWYAKFLKQLKDDTEGKEWGEDQSIAIFGKPGGDKFEFVITGRHMTLRADGYSNKSVAFGGPIFYGHAASGFNEKVHHPNNIFWPQAQLANKVYEMLDDKQQKVALIAKRPKEAAVEFHGEKGAFPGIPIAKLSDDQKKHMQKVLSALIEPFRKEDQDEALECLKKLGGLDKCSLAFYEEGDIGNDQEWDNWRLEGPSFVWYFRGEPHVHVWVNVASDPSIPLNAKG